MWKHFSFNILLYLCEKNQKYYVSFKTFCCLEYFFILCHVFLKLIQPFTLIFFVKTSFCNTSNLVVFCEVNVNVCVCGRDDYEKRGKMKEFTYIKYCGTSQYELRQLLKKENETDMFWNFGAAKSLLEITCTIQFFYMNALKNYDALRFIVQTYEREKYSNNHQIFHRFKFKSQ